jgi:glutamate--cysteine ligase
MSAPTEVLYRDIERRLFTTHRELPSDGPLIGAEVELIPFSAESGRRVAVSGATGSSLSILRPWADMHGWLDSTSTNGTPVFTLPDGGRVTFEPGGQLELSAAPACSVSELLRSLENTLLPLQDEAARNQIQLLAGGIDPVSSIENVALQLDCDRYRRMTDYFESIGPAGVRMMRQTATCHINIDLGDQPEQRWLLLNGLAPVLVAMFANSPRYEGQSTGCRSYRAETWRTLDWSRTGLPARGGDPIEEYREFALAARAIITGPVDGEYQPFSWWWDSGKVGIEEWHSHLSTLFPEVRPRGYYEVRAIDSIPIPFLAAPLAFLAGLTYHPESAARALEVVGKPRTASLHIAGAAGLADPRLGRMARTLVDIALEGCRWLGPDFISEADLSRAGDFFDRYTRRRRSLADDQVASTEPAVPVRAGASR